MRYAMRWKCGKIQREHHPNSPPQGELNGCRRAFAARPTVAVVVVAIAIPVHVAIAVAAVVAVAAAFAGVVVGVVVLVMSMFLSPGEDRIQYCTINSQDFCSNERLDAISDSKSSWLVANVASNVPRQRA